MESAGLRTVTGSYDGDGNSAHAITGVGFKPDLVLIKGNLSGVTIAKTSTMSGASSKELGPNTALAPNRILSLDVDGFTVGSDSPVNALGSTYYWVAFQTTPEQMIVGSYTGDGLDNRSIFLGWSPCYVLLMAESAEQAMQRFSSEVVDRSLPLAASGEQNDRIQDFEPDGFQIGKHNTVNNSGIVYHYVAWRRSTGISADGIYVGDNSTDRPFTNLGFAPKYVLISRMNTGSPTVHRPESLVGDNTLYIDATGSLFGNGIKTLDSNGFTLGSDPAVNASSQPYYWVAFGGEADLSLTDMVNDATPSEGDTLTFTMTLHNLGPGVATGIRVDAALPPGLTYVGSTRSAGSYDPATGAWNLASFAVSIDATLTITARVAPGTAGSVLTHTATVTAADQLDPVSTNNSASVGISVDPGTDLALVTTADLLAPSEGDTLTLTATLGNLGPETATGILVDAAVPTGLTYLNDTSTVGAYDPSTGVWGVDSLTAGADATLSLTAVVDLGTAGSTLVHTTTIASVDQTDPVSVNNSASVSISVQLSDLALTSTVDNFTPAEGDTVAFTVTLMNLGPNPATRISVGDSMSSALMVTGSSSTTGSFVSGVWSIDAVPADSSATLLLRAVLSSGSGATALTNVATILQAHETDLVSANNTTRIEIRTVEVEAIPLGSTDVLPGTVDIPLLDLRMRNHHLQLRRITDLSFSISPGIDHLRLWLDDGDQVFDAKQDSLLAEGIPVAGTWPAANLGLELPVEVSRSLFLSGDVSLITAHSGQALNASVQSSADFSWDNPTALVTLRGFPLRSPGSIRVADIALAQLLFTPQPADTVAPGSSAVPLLQLHLPDDGGSPDQLDRFDVLQQGTAVAGSEVTALHLQQLVVQSPSAAGLGSNPASMVRQWKTLDAAQFFHTGGGRWSASGFGLPVPIGGLEVRILADIGVDAQEGRTLRMALPLLALEFSSGRSGPKDSPWSNPDSILIRSEEVLSVMQLAVDTVTSAQPRNAVDLPVLGLTLEARSATSDTLQSLRLLHTSTGPSGPAANPHAQIARADLWVDVNGDAKLQATDLWVASAHPNLSGELIFGESTSLGVALLPSTAVDFIVSLTPDSVLVRDAEMLSVRLPSSSDIVTAGGLPVQLPGPMDTLVPPVIDGQSAAGYSVKPIPGGALFAGTTQKVVLDLAIPPNGVDDDILHAFQVTNTGTVVASDIKTMQLVADDGNEALGSEDTLVGILANQGPRTWAVSGLSFPLEAANRNRRFFVSIEASTNPTSGATLQLRVPLFGVTVESGNDGPTDEPLPGGDPLVFSIPDRVTWIAGIVNDHEVRPDQSRQPIMVLETFNGYTTARALTSLRVTLTGTATQAEYDTWSLVSDNNMNGLLDPDESAVAVGTPTGDAVLFEGFEYSMGALQQQRLLVTYGLQSNTVRDGAVIDATIANAEAIRYREGSTLSDGAFPLDSPGIDTVDGFVRDQIISRTLPSRSLGGGETNVLLFDLLLPSNGWTPDVLQEFVLEPMDSVTTGVLGQDIANLRLWSETDTEVNAASFDPSEDRLLQTAVSNGNRLRFANLEEAVPVGGQRVYITMDVMPSPTPGRQVYMRVPILGIDMASGNDGPNDTDLEATAIHAFSASALLASVEVSSGTSSVGQSIDVTVRVRNRGDSVLDGVFPTMLQVVPTGAASLSSGPTPSQLTLNPSAEGSFLLRYRLDQPGQIRFTSRVTVADSSLWSDLATSPPVNAVSPPSALDLELVSNLPPSVYRGQTVTPVVWQFRHPDTDGTAGIRIDTLSVEVEDGSGNALAASAVLEALRISTGGLVHALWDSIPATSVLRIGLDPPLRLDPFQSVDLPLTVTISREATAREFRFRVSSAAAVRAVDANSEIRVALNATLPWSNAGATVHSRAVRIDLTAMRSLPETVNRGQVDIPAGLFTLDLPGTDDESEVRLLQLSLVLRDSSGSSIEPQDLLNRIRVISGPTTLLETNTFTSVDDRLPLPLSIPVLIASGAPQTVELRFDLLASTSVGNFSVSLEDTSDFLVQDATSGERVSVQLTDPDTFPWTEGPAVVEEPAGNVESRTTSRTPASVVAGTSALKTLDVTITRRLTAQPTADVELRSLIVLLRDDLGNTLVPTRILSAVRLLSNGSFLPTSGPLPSFVSPIRIDLETPLRLAAGDSVVLTLEVDLASSIPTAWLRFALEPDALELDDANDPARVLAATGGLPFATEPMRVVLPARQALFGPISEPPTNVARGATAEILTLRLQHPGSVLESPLQPERLVVLLRDVSTAPLAVSAFASGARLRFPEDGAQLATASASDSLTFDLSGLRPLAPGESREATLELDVLGAPSITDLRLALESTGFLVRSDAGLVAVGGIEGVSLPWVSETVHLSANDLSQSLGTYPNPFIPSRQGQCNITFFLPAAARVSAEIYSLDGERVIALLDGEPMSAGLYDGIPWDGRNGRGELVRSGTYLLRLVVSGPGGGTLLHKMAVQR